MYGDIKLGKLNEDQISFLYDYITSFSTIFIKKTIEDDYYLSIPIQLSDDGTITDDNQKEYYFNDLYGIKHSYIKYEGRFISDAELEGCVHVNVHSHEISPCLYEIFPIIYQMNDPDQVAIYLQSLKYQSIIGKS